ncbi:MAG: DUF167 domain-containing protein [Rickettsiales bacterium]|nr:DUF167 domain-containing protein [Rickettsiales bacterium]
MPFIKHDNGYYLNIKVTTNHSANKIGEIITINNKKYQKIFIKEIPHKNSANQALIEILAEKLHIPKSTITIKAGKISKIKLIYIENIGNDKIDFK